MNAKCDTLWQTVERMAVGAGASESLLAGIEAVRVAALRHHRRVDEIRTNLRWPKVEGVVVAEVATVLGLARTVLPVPEVFSVARLERIGAARAIAHGTEDYSVDLVAQTCSCPQFRYRGVLCKHLRAALGIGGGSGIGLGG